MYEYKASLVRVVDGDTVDITIDLGFTVTTKQRVRLAGINAPEHNTAEGQAAIAFSKNWFAANPTGLVVQSSKPGAGDKYGRYLARIYLAGLCLNDDLIAKGHAVAWDGQGTKPV